MGLSSKPREKQRPEKLDHQWYFAEEAKTADERQAVEDYYLNETRIWRALRKILEKKFGSLDRPLDLEHPNVHGKIFFDEGQRKALQEIYQLIPRPRENTDE